MLLINKYKNGFYFISFFFCYAIQIHKYTYMNIEEEENCQFVTGFE